MYIISRCLLGFDCKYDGGNNRNEDIIEFCRTHDYVTVCPESAAGLTSPREPAEIVMTGTERKVADRNGRDLTELFDYGARLSLESVLVEARSRKDHSCIIEGAILKARSPSCGAGSVYDGTFTGTLTGGLGIFADKLLDACLEERNDRSISDENRLFSPGFKVCDESNFKRVFQK
jgi:uncharacterized protein YbbK (DUF523 family)